MKRAAKRRWRYLCVGGDARYPLDHLTKLARVNHSELARLSGYSLRAIVRANSEGMTWIMADELACLLGYHPAEVWPEWIDHGLGVLDLMYPEGDRVAWLAMESA